MFQDHEQSNEFDRLTFMRLFILLKVIFLIGTIVFFCFVLYIGLLRDKYLWVGKLL